jgi:hypothetical protein
MADALSLNDENPSIFAPFPRKKTLCENPCDGSK